MISRSMDAIKAFYLKFGKKSEQTFGNFLKRKSHDLNGHKTSPHGEKA